MAQELTPLSGAMHVEWASFVYEVPSIGVFDRFGGRCPTPDFLPGRVALAVSNPDTHRVAEGVNVRFTLRDDAGFVVQDVERTVPQILAREQRAAVFPIFIFKDRARVVSADAEIVHVDTWLAAVPRARPAVNVLSTSLRHFDPTPVPRGQPQDPCSTFRNTNRAEVNVANHTAAALVDVTIVVVEFPPGDVRPIGFGVAVVNYLPAGATRSLTVSWYGEGRTQKSVKAYANYSLNNPPPLAPPQSPSLDGGRPGANDTGCPPSPMEVPRDPGAATHGLPDL